MEGQVEELGQFATAAAAASVLDDHTAPGAPAGHGTACANCGATLAGRFCSQCGQAAHVHRSIGHVVEEILHGVTHFDSRFWNTIPLLLFRPGKLTRDYVHGRRARYIAPVALFLLTIFTMFLVFGFTAAPTVPEGAIEVNVVDARATLADLDAQLAAIDVDLKAARADPARADDVTALVVARTALEAARGRAAGAKDGYTSPSGDLAQIIASNIDRGNIRINTGNPELDGKALATLRNPDLLFYKMKQKGYKLSFLLVPLSLPWMLLLFAWKRDVRLYDHAIFLLYSISFMSILFMVAAGLVSVGFANDTVFAILFGIVPVAHMFAQLKEGYALSWFSAAWRTMLLSMFALTTVALYFALILLLGLVD